MPKRISGIYEIRNKINLKVDECNSVFAKYVCFTAPQATITCMKKCGTTRAAGVVK